MLIIAWILSNLRIIFIVTALSVVTGFIAYVYHLGYSTAISDGIKTAIPTREKQNEALTLRPDDDNLLDGMRNGKF